MMPQQIHPTPEKILLRKSAQAWQMLLLHCSAQERLFTTIHTDLIYFKMRALAEAPQLLMHYADIEFSCRR